MRSLLIALLMVNLASAQQWAPDQNIDNVLPISFNLHDAFGAASDADSAPGYRVYEQTTGTPILTGTLSAFDASNTDGFYNGEITLTAANGFEVGKTYKLRVSATVDGVTGAAVTLFRIVPTTSQTVADAMLITPTGGASAPSAAGSVHYAIMQTNDFLGDGVYGLEKIRDLIVVVDGIADTIISRIGDPATPAGNTIAKQIDDIEVTGAADTRDLLPADHVWRMRRSGEGAWRSTNKCVVHPGDTVRLAWNCDAPGLLPGGTIISTQGTPELVTPSDDITITSPDIGHDAKHAKVEITIAGNATPGTHWIKTQFTPLGASGPKTVYGEIEVAAEPE